MSLQARLVAAFQAIAADIKDLRSRGSTIPEFDSDPVTVQPGQPWVLKTIENRAGTIQAFVGGFPAVTATDDNKYELSYRTADGSTVRTLLQ